MDENTWFFKKDLKAVETSKGAERRVGAYNEEMMCVENTFEEGAVGAMHQHPHLQIAYIASGEFEFTVDGETKVVSAGDSLLVPGNVQSIICQ